VEIKAPRLLKIYACCLVALTGVDLFWLMTYSGAISSTNTGIVAEIGAEGTDVPQEVISLQYGIVAAGINNFFTLMPEFFAFCIRVASVALWVLMWSKGLLDGSDSDMYNDPHLSSSMPTTSGGYNIHSGMEYQASPAVAVPSSPVRSGRKGGNAGPTFKPSSTFTVDGGYQDIDSDRDTLLN
jgi:hypothetical protein